MRTILLNFKWMWLFSVFFKRDIIKCYNRAVEVILVLVSLSMGCSSVFIAFWVSIWQPYIHMWFVWHSTALYLFLNSGYCFFLIYYFYFGKRPVFLFICSFLKVFILGFSIKLIDNVVLVSGVQQSGSVIHIHVSILFQSYSFLCPLPHQVQCFVHGRCFIKVIEWFIYRLNWLPQMKCSLNKNLVEMFQLSSHLNSHNDVTVRLFFIILQH